MDFLRRNSMSTVRELIEMLGKTYDLDEHVATSIWSAVDVKAQIKDYKREISLTDAEINEIIEAMDHGHNACVGINWDVIDCHINMYLAERSKKDVD